MYQYFIPLYGQVTVHYTDTPHFIYSSVDGRWGYFHFLMSANNAAIMCWFFLILFI